MYLSEKKLRGWGTCCLELLARFFLYLNEFDQNLNLIKLNRNFQLFKSLLLISASVWVNERYGVKYGRSSDYDVFEPGCMQATNL